MACEPHHESRSRNNKGLVEMNDFVAFRTLQNAVPCTEEAAQLICDCLNWYVKRSGKPLEAVERALALYKLKVTSGDRSE